MADSAPSEALNSESILVEAIDGNSQSRVQSRKRKQRATIRPEEDLFLLKETVATFPWAMPRNKRTAGWQSVVRAVNACILDAERHFDVRRAREKVTLLLEKHRSEELESLRASGTEEDYNKRSQLLTDLTQLLADEKAMNQGTAAEKEEEERQGEVLRKAAMDGMFKDSIPVDSTSPSVSSEGSRKVKKNSGQYKGKLSSMERKLDEFLENDLAARQKEFELLQRQQELDEKRQALEERRIALQERRFELENSRRSQFYGV